MTLRPDRRIPAVEDPSPSPSSSLGPEDHEVAGQILGFLSDSGLLVGRGLSHDYLGIERSTTGWTLSFDVDDWISVETIFAGTQLKITGMSPALASESRGRRRVLLETGRSRFSLGPPLLDRSGGQVAIETPFVWSGPIPSEEDSLNGCRFELLDNQGVVGRSSSTFTISPPEAESGRDGALRDTVAVDPSVPTSRALSTTLDCSDGLARPIRLAGFGCQEGIDGPGNEPGETFPPKPYFEVFNMWTGVIRDGCLGVMAGRQGDRLLDEPGSGPPHYVKGGVLRFWGKARPFPIEIFESDLPQPIRLVDYRREGGKVTLILQSLDDCSLAGFIVNSAEFASVPGWVDADTYPCVTEAEKAQLPTMVTHDCFDTKQLPKSIIFACGDYGFVAKKLLWDSWGQDEASGNGVFLFKVFDPPGPNQRRSGTISLSERTWCSGAMTFVFAEATVVYDRPFRGRSVEKLHPDCPP